MLSQGVQAKDKPAARPNILIIMADDLGYSDIGAYGGEIRTPNLDRLAAGGVRMTHFHSAPSCSPTRAMLLSGADAHVAGLGAMAEGIPPAMRGREGFEGALSQRVATLAERFAARGYATLMAGKWHLGQADGQRPAQRGFQHSYALLQGAANHFGRGGFSEDPNPLTSATYVEDDKSVTPGTDFYSSDVYAQKIIAQIGKVGKKTPFFAYLAFTAPHSPLQAPVEDIANYRGRYADGWHALAQRRMAAMRAKDVLPGTLPMDSASFGPSQQSWDALTPAQQAVEARKAEVYAAMISRLDANVGKVLTALEKSGQRNNTLILFLSDNGPAGETADRFSVMPGVADKYAKADNSLAGMGGANSFLFYSPQWSEASSAPSRLFKGFLTEGGTLVPAIWNYPGLPAGATNALVGDVRDIAPTLLKLAGVPVENRIGDRKVAYLEGADILPWLESGKDNRPITHVAAEFYGQAMVRQGPWKLLRVPAPFGSGQWQLFNTIDDPAERQDRSGDHPDMVAGMKAAWKDYAMRHGLPEAPPSPPAAGHQH
ncbi:hypothetical protein A7Q26_02160 [Sphingobium sp. TCM1]|nr:hypothetical protein A7Q26_02160 [Sphingobium sp. TCM1]